MYAERQMQTGKTDLLFLIFLYSINKTFFSGTVFLASTFYKYLHFKTNYKYIIIYTSIETVKAFCPVRYSILFVAQRGCGISSLGSPQATWTWSWATCSRWPSLSWVRGGMNDLQRSLSTSAILWFCEFRVFSIQWIFVGSCNCVLLKLKPNVEIFKQSRF